MITCFPVSAGYLLLLIGLCTVAHGGLCGAWASTGDGLWLVSTPNGIIITYLIHILFCLVNPSTISKCCYFSFTMMLIVCPQHAVDPEPGTCSHRHGSRSHTRHQRIPVFGSVFLRLHLQSVFSVCLSYESKIIQIPFRLFECWFSTLFLRSPVLQLHWWQ